MTEQELPVGERNELLDDLLTAATTVEEHDASMQESPAADEQPEPSVHSTEATAEVAAPALERDSGEPPSTAVAPSQAGMPNDAADLPKVSTLETAAGSTAEVAPEPDAAAPTAAPALEQYARGVYDIAPETNVAPAEASSAPEPAAAPTAAPVLEQHARGVYHDPASASAEGASYTPVADAEGGRPRRIKDLEPGMELEGRVTSIALYGIFVDIGVGRDGLVHISEMSDTRIDSPSDMVQIGDTVKVRIKNIEPEGRRISLTMRSKEPSGEPRARGRKKPDLNRDAMTALKVGDTVEGTVTSIAPFGVFVDIGVGKDGLVHVSELAEGRVEKPEDAVQAGQTYTFRVLEVDADVGRISLSLRRAQRAQRMQLLEKGQIIEGTVSGLAPFGAFIDIGVGRDGLVHISELTEGRVGKVEDAVKVGDKVTVRVIEADSQSKRISLTMRLEDRPAAEQPAAEPGTSELREERSPRQDRFARPMDRDRGPRQDRDRGPRQDQRRDQPPMVVSSSEEPEEEFSGNATLEDLVSKFGSDKRDRKRRGEDDEENWEDRYTRKQRDAIRRTLQQLNDDE